MAENQQPHTSEREPLSYSDYFMAVALLTAKRSKDPNTQVGACIVNQENKIVGTGYNRMPNGCDGKLPWARTGPKLESKYIYVCHAELNAIINKSKADMNGCTIYVTLFPCNECAKLIIQAGLSKVVYLSDKYHDEDETTASRRMLDLAEIPYRAFTSTMHQIVIDFNDKPGSENAATE